MKKRNQFTPSVSYHEKPMMEEEEEAWKLRVLSLLEREGPLNSSEIGSEARRPGKRTITALLKSDGRFRLNSSGKFSLVNRYITKPTPKKKATTIVKEFIPSKTLHAPSHVCWEVVLSSPCAAATLSSWKWIWMLRQVSRAFRTLVQPDRWVLWMCQNDARPCIWKSKANDVLALTANDLKDVVFEVVCGVGRMRYKETHLMHRQALLKMALAKHGGTVARINAVFLKRNSKK